VQQPTGWFVLQQVGLVALGGGIGAAMRYLTSEWLATDGFPWPTFVVNLVGSLFLGAVAVALAEHVVSQNVALLLGTGLLGGLTTMSTFSVETIRMFEEQQSGLAFTYVGLTMILCPLMALIGWRLSTAITATS
jgi:CrcB protein